MIEAKFFRRVSKYNKIAGSLKPNVLATFENTTR